MNFVKKYKELEKNFEIVSIKDSLRANNLKIKEVELIKRLKKKRIKLEKIKWLDNGYYYESEFSLGATPEYLLGYYYLQEAVSQLPAKVLNPLPGEYVLDMAASPGGKTTQISSYMNNKGVIVALDNNSMRIKSLTSNLERLGVENVIVYNKDARYASDLGLKFDKILLDAPCSGNFVVEKDYFKKRTLQDLESRVKLQRELLKEALKCLKKEGVLVYSTCSLEPEENEQNIQWLLDNHNVELENVNVENGQEGYTKELGLSEEIKKTRRFWPHKHNVQGFFVAKIIFRG